MSDAPRNAYESPDPKRPDATLPAAPILQHESSAGPRATAAHDPYAALRHPNYRYFAIGNALAVIGMQMYSATVGLELYCRTHSPTALGLVGFFQVFPIVSLALVAGHVVDRFNRKRIIMLGQFLLACAAVALGLASLYHDAIPELPILTHANEGLARVAHFFGERSPNFSDRHVPIMFALLFLNGAVRTFNQPAKQSILPQLVPSEVFPNAVTWNSSVFELCTVIGPMIAGFGIWAIQTRVGPVSPVPYAMLYFLTALTQGMQLAFFLPIRPAATDRRLEPLTSASLLAGIRFVWRTDAIIATITLDMFAVLLGGAVALLPIYADILHVGAFGFGCLRRPVGRRRLHGPRPGPPATDETRRQAAAAGRGDLRRRHDRLRLHRLRAARLGPTLGFGIALLALVVGGAVDNISVVIRNTLVQMLTPDHMRGRVSAVNSVFISTSNELGALESGLTAAAFGAASPSSAGASAPSWSLAPSP